VILTRAILYLIAAVLVLSVVQSVVRIVLKGFADLFNPATSAESGPRNRTPPLPTSDALKKDPVCGTFIAASTSLHKTVAGETYYFCSPECRDRFRG
jgi:YHS domain-containing protein